MVTGTLIFSHSVPNASFQMSPCSVFADFTQCEICSGNPFWCTTEPFSQTIQRASKWMKLDAVVHTKQVEAEVFGNQAGEAVLVFRLEERLRRWLAIHQMMICTPQGLNDAGEGGCPSVRLETAIRNFIRNSSTHFYIPEQFRNHIALLSLKLFLKML